MSPIDPPHKDDSSSVSDEEFLLRRFASAPGLMDGPHPRFSVFLPSKSDVDGLSLYREGLPFLNPSEVLRIAQNEKIRQNGGVVAVQCGLVRAGNMTVVPDPIPGESGHVLIPEINIRDYELDKQHKRHIKALAEYLTRLVIEGNGLRIAPAPVT